MAEYIPLNTRVSVFTIDGELTGTVVAFRDTHLAELNPEPPPAVEGKNILGIPVVVPEPDLQRIITLYTIKLDNPEAYPGLVDPDGTITTYKFIKPLEAQP